MDEGAVRRLTRECALYRGLLNLNAQTEPESFLKDALELIVEAVQAEQGYLELFEKEGSLEERTWWTAAGCSEQERGEIQSLVSRGIIAETLGAGEIIITPSALLDPRFRDRKSVRSANIHAVLCAPIGKDPPLGVLYLQRRSAIGMFSEEDRACAEIFTHHLAPLAHTVFERRLFDAGRDPTHAYRQRMHVEEVIGSSQALANLLREVELVAKLDVCVLLTGETGSGKSQIARIIHDASPRSSRPFLELNCAALPENLLESELFGALPGSHSTATRRIEGKVTAARGGTLFLDEIGELAVTSQAKLLQLLQTQEYYPLGQSQPSVADIRIVAATNVDLKRAVAERRFREDLFYRLQVLPIRVPSLAERKEDIPALARHFCELAVRTHKLRHVELSPGAQRALSVVEWPGNLRELAHRVEAATIRAAGDSAPQVEVAHLAMEPEKTLAGEHDGVTFHTATRRYQRQLLDNALKATGGNVSEAARRLDLTRGHIYTLMKTLGLDRS
jgi:Nif-specific regulatory protein